MLRYKRMGHPEDLETITCYKGLDVPISHIEFREAIFAKTDVNLPN